MKEKSVRRTWAMAGMILWAALFASSCTKVLVHSKDKDYEPVTQLFNTSVDLAHKAGAEALTRLGYKIEREDTEPNRILTKWQSTKATSHYIDLFDHRDYGTVSAYYRIKLNIEERGGRALVSVSAPTRAIVYQRMRTSYREEKKVLRKMTDLLRKEDFEITNVGVEE